MGHTHSSLCHTVETFIVHRDKVLLRFHDKYRMWLSVGGHVEHDPAEDPNEAALRECREEVGLDVELVGDKLAVGFDDESYRELVPPRAQNRHRVSQTHEHVCDVYFARSATDRLEIPDDDERAEARWFTREELNGLEGLHPRVAVYARAALEELAGN